MIKHSYRILAGAAMITGLMAGLPVQAHEAVGATSDDMALAQQVQQELLKAPKFQDADVDLVVRVTDGNVNLSGWIDKAPDDSSAHQAAMSVPGVKSVTSNFRAWSSD
ncbi:MAG: hypothetical protein RLY71_3174 [Pseudomonadota bacterium]|jgi:osmotically-inducible protein OsmY